MRDQVVVGGGVVVSGGVAVRALVVDRRDADECYIRPFGCVAFY